MGNIANSSLKKYNYYLDYKGNHTENFINKEEKIRKVVKHLNRLLQNNIDHNLILPQFVNKILLNPEYNNNYDISYFRGCIYCRDFIHKAIVLMYEKDRNAEIVNNYMFLVNKESPHEINSFEKIISDSGYGNLVIRFNSDKKTMEEEKINNEFIKYVRILNILKSIDKSPYTYLTMRCLEDIKDNFNLSEEYYNRAVQEVGISDKYEFCKYCKKIITKTSHDIHESPLYAKAGQPCVHDTK